MLLLVDSKGKRSKKSKSFNGKLKELRRSWWWKVCENIGGWMSFLSSSWRETLVMVKKEGYFNGRKVEVRKRWWKDWIQHCLLMRAGCQMHPRDIAGSSSQKNPTFHHQQESYNNAYSTFFCISYPYKESSAIQTDSSFLSSALQCFGVRRRNRHNHWSRFAPSA